MFNSWSTSHRSLPSHKWFGCLQSSSFVWGTHSTFHVFVLATTHWCEISDQAMLARHSCQGSGFLRLWLGWDYSLLLMLSQIILLGSSCRLTMTEETIRWHLLPSWVLSLLMLKFRTLRPPCILELIQDQFGDRTTETLSDLWWLYSRVPHLIKPWWNPCCGRSVLQSQMQLVRIEDWL